MKTSKEVMMELSSKRAVKRSVCHVYMALEVLEKNFSDRIIRMTLDEIGENSGLSKPTVCRAIKKLIDMGLVKKVGSGRYMINDFESWAIENGYEQESNSEV